MTDSSDSLRNLGGLGVSAGYFMERNKSRSMVVGRVESCQDHRPAAENAEVSQREESLSRGHVLNAS